jgi:hypothetical protein
MIRGVEISEHLPKWRNWQTRYVQGVVRVTSCGFESHLRHQSSALLMMGDSLRVERLVLAQVVGVRIPVPQPTQKPSEFRRRFVFSSLHDHPNLKTGRG